MRFKTPLLCALLVTCLSHTASAQSAPTDVETREIERRFNEGKELLQRRKFAEARTKFLQACAVHHTVNCPKNLGAAEFELGMFSEATTHMEEFLRHNDLPKNDPILARARKLYDQAFAKSGHLEIAAPSGATVFVDDTAIGKAPLDVVHVAVGAHTLRATLSDGRTTSATASADAGVTVKVSLMPPEPEPAAAPSIVPPGASQQPAAARVPPSTTIGARSAPDTPSTPASAGITSPPTISWVLAGVGVASIGLGVGFGLDANSKAADVDRMRNAGCAPPSSCGSLADTINAEQSSTTLSRIFYGVGGVAVAGAAVAWWLAPRRPASAASAWVAPVVTANGAGLHAGGRF